MVLGRAGLGADDVLEAADDGGEASGLGGAPLVPADRGQEDDDAQLDAGLAQGKAFGDGADGKAPGADGEQGLGCLEQAVAVGIGLDDGQDPVCRAEALEVALDGIQVNMGAGR